MSEINSFFPVSLADARIMGRKPIWRFALRTLLRLIEKRCKANCERELSFRDEAIKQWQRLPHKDNSPNCSHLGERKVP